MSSPAVQPLLALLASHVGGNPTQYMFEQAFAHHDLDWRYLTFEIAPENLGDAVRGLRAWVFVAGSADPHKQAVIPLLDASPRPPKSWSAGEPHRPRRSKPGG